MGSRLVAAALVIVCACTGPGGSSNSDTSGQSSGSSAQSSGSSQASSASSASSEMDSIGEGIGNTLNSRYPSSVQTSEASRPSSDQSTGSSAESSQSTTGSTENTENSTQNSSQTQVNLAPIFSTVGITTTAGAVGLIIWLATRPTPEAEQAAVAFLRANRFQLQEDLALGAGRSIDDLAALARIRPQNRERFAAILVAHRRELLELADARQLTPERAVRTLRRIGELAELDPRLREDGERAIAELGAAR